MQVLINLDNETYNRIKDAKSVPDMYGADIVNGLNAIKDGKVYYTPTGEQIPEADAIEILQTFREAMDTPETAYKDALLGAIDRGIEALRGIESNKVS